MWSDATLLSRQGPEHWDPAMLTQAREEADLARAEVVRIERGVALLQTDPQLRRAFALANRSFVEAPGIAHQTWRGFQLGFMLGNLAALPDASRDGERS